MSLDDDIRIISSAPLFDSLRPEQLRLIAFGSERTRFGHGRTIYREGDRADCAFVVSSGEIALTRIVNGQEEAVKTAGQGSVLGEMALLTETSRLTNAVAATDCELLRINRSLFQRMLSEYPDTAAELHAELSERLKTFLAEIARLDSRFKTIGDL